MQLFKKLSFSFLTLLFSSQLIANDCMPQNECCSAPSSLFCLDYLTFRAEGLYLWAGESDLQFASENHYAQSQIGSVSSSDYNSNYKSPKFLNRLGYRVALDYLNPCSCVGFSVTYFHFNTTARGKVATPDFAAVSGNIGSESIFVTPLFGNNLGEQNPFNKCGANLKLNINLLDFDFGSTFCCNSCVSFHPFIGVRYADISENYRIRSSGVQSSSDRLQDIVTTSTNRLKNGFTGFGIHAGFNFDWALNCEFSLYGKAAGSILYGRNHRKSLADSTRSDFTNNTVTNGDQYIKANLHGPRTILELGIGVKWNYCICAGQSVDLKLGWEQLLFINNNRFDNSYFGGKGTSYAFSRNGDLGLQGVVFGAEYAF